jgi:transposase
MADAKTWEERVADWRGSGQSAEEYCKGKGFSPGTLYRGGAAG